MPTEEARRPVLGRRRTLVGKRLGWQPASLLRQVGGKSAPESLEPLGKRRQETAALLSSAVKKRTKDDKVRVSFLDESPGLELVDVRPYDLSPSESNHKLDLSRSIKVAISVMRSDGGGSTKLTSTAVLEPLHRALREILAEVDWAEISIRELRGMLEERCGGRDLSAYRREIVNMVQLFLAVDTKGSDARRVKARFGSTWHREPQQGTADG